MAGVTAAAHDNAVANEDGVTIYYVWTNNYTELAVSYRGNYYDSYSNEYSGNVVIPESVTYNGATYPVTSIGSSAFYGCSKLADCYCHAENVPTTGADLFGSCPISSATLHVSATSLSSYHSTAPWSGFGNIVGDLVPKCATPTIALAGGRLTFDCETEGVEYVYEISMTGSQSGRGNDIMLPSLPNTYAVSVYATKEGYEDSDVATETLTFQTKTGDANGDGEISIADITTLIGTIVGSGNADVDE